VKRRQSNERNEQKTDEASERQQKKLTGDAKKMKKSIRKIERRTRGRDTTDAMNRGAFMLSGIDRVRWRTVAANDETVNAWRDAA
jgi:hypothetical protein